MGTDNGLYKDLTYKVIGILYAVHNELGPVHKENIYVNAIAIELEENHINFEREKQITVTYKGRRVGIYRPDFIIEDKVVLEIKAVPVMTKNMIDQMYYYLKGTRYKLVLLVNFGTKKLSIKRRIYT